MEEITNFCQNSADVWQLVGYFLLVFKIVIPIIIIILGMIDLGKAVVSSDEKAIQKSAKTLLIRVLAGVLIFFVPTIVGLIFNLVSGFKDEVGQKWEVCKACVVSPSNSNCAYYACLKSDSKTAAECNSQYPNRDK